MCQRSVRRPVEAAFGVARVAREHRSKSLKAFLHHQNELQAGQLLSVIGQLGLVGRAPEHFVQEEDEAASMSSKPRGILDGCKAEHPPTVRSRHAMRSALQAHTARHVDCRDGKW